MTAAHDRMCDECAHVRINDRRRYVCAHPSIIASSAREFGRQEPVSISYARDLDALCGPRGARWRKPPNHEGQCP